MGLQIPFNFHSERQKKAVIREYPHSFGQSLPRTGQAEGVYDLAGAPDDRPVHMLIEIPPKHPVSSIVGFLKGKSAIAVARSQGKMRNFNGENFCARGYAVSTVGFEEQAIRRYIREQEDEDKTTGSF